MSADPPGWAETKAALYKRYGLEPDATFDQLIEAMGVESDAIDNDSYPPEEEHEL